MEDNTQNKPHRKIVVVPDKFKGSLTALEAAEAIRDAILRQEPDTQVLLRPMADGGEGSLDVMERSLLETGRHIEKVAVDTVGPLGGRVRAHYLLYDSSEHTQKREVFIELAQSTGLQLIPEGKRDILHATSHGLGEVIRFAVQECGVEKVVLAIGGSATDDGGAGMLTALGYRYKNNTVIGKTSVPYFLSNVAGIDNSLVKEICPQIEEVTFEVACDVQNPLLGPNGATMVYAPQKGASPADLEELESGMRNWAQVVQKWYKSKQLSLRSITDGDNMVISTPSCPSTSSGTEVPCYEVPGTGAAGGIGFALYSVLGAKLVPGWKLFSAMTGLEEDIASADLVITGEGRFDSQSLSGKLPSGIAELCRAHHKPLWVVCGSDRTTLQQKSTAGISKVLALDHFCQDLHCCIANARHLIITHLDLQK